MMKRGIVILAALGVIGCGVVVLAQSQTIYRSKEECFLCGDSSNSILDLYDEVDGIGVLCFNNFMVSTLGVCEEEPGRSGSNTTINSSGDSGSIIKVDANINRRFAEVDISLRENSRPDEKRMSEVMCKSCAESILQNNKYDVAFIDYRPREVIPIDETMHVYCRGDYVIYGVSSSEDSIKYLVFYAPEQSS